LSFQGHQHSVSAQPVSVMLAKNKPLKPKTGFLPM
jgi:hypothetical protein